MKINFWSKINRRLIRAATGTVLVVAPVSAASILGSAADYAVLYEGTGGHTLQITNVTINGNIGVGGTGNVHDSGPSTISGRLDFSAGNSNQFSNSNGTNVGPTSVNYSVAAVTNALNTVNNLSTNLGGETGTNLTISGNQTINASSGTLDANGNRVFTVTSYNENDGNAIVINGDGAGDNVVFNFTSAVKLDGDVTLNGLTDDQVIWNFTDSGGGVQLNNNASSFKAPLAFQGVILAPNDTIQITNANLDGRVFGGDSQDMQIVSGTTINTPTTGVPEPSSYLLASVGFLGFAISRRKILAAFRR
jgi:choice-of-anchor A domain-containing protein